MRDNEGMEKNYLLAIVLSMAILLGYPWLMKWFYGDPQPQPAQTLARSAEEQNRNQALPTKESAEEPSLKPAEGPFWNERAKPTLTPFSNSVYDIEFSTLGGTITKLNHIDPLHQKEKPSELLYEGNADNPGIFGIRFLNEDADLDQTLFRLEKLNQAEGVLEFVYEKPGDYRVLKRFTVEKDRAAIWLDVQIENLSGRVRHYPVEVAHALNYGEEEGQKRANVEAVVKGEKIKSKQADSLKKKNFLVSEPIDWAGVVKKYYGILIKTNGKIISSEANADIEKSILYQTLRLEPVTVQPGGKTEQQYLIYAGPQQYEELKEFDAGFEALLAKGFWGWLKIWLLIALKFLFGFFHNYGWAILILTLILKGAFTPLTHMSFESMKKMQALQPKIKSLQERFKKDPTKLNKEMMELYKRNRVNPMMGCLPMLLQIPIFIAFYQVLNEAIELKGAPFIWWIKDLAEPDRLFVFPFTIPVIGDAFNFLPILMLLSMFWQQKLTPQTGMPPEQAKMMQFLPLIFGFLFYGMPSGLVLYWFMNNVLSIIHQIFIKKMVIALHHEDQE